MCGDVKGCGGAIGGGRWCTLGAGGGWCTWGTWWRRVTALVIRGAAKVLECLVDGRHLCVNTCEIFLHVVVHGRV